MRPWIKIIFTAALIASLIAVYYLLLAKPGIDSFVFKIWAGSWSFLRRAG